MRVLVLFIVLGFLVLLAVGSLAGGLADPLTEFLGWLTAHATGPPERAPYVVLTATFLILRLALLPYWLTHARVNRETLAVDASFAESRKPGRATGWARDLAQSLEDIADVSSSEPRSRMRTLPTNWATTRYGLLALTDALALLLLLGAARGGPAGWPVIPDLAAARRQALWPRAAGAGFIVASGLVCAAVLRLAATGAFARLTGARRAPGGFVERHTRTGACLLLWLPGSLVHLLLFLGIAMYHRANPFLFHVAWAFVLVHVTAAVVAEVLSLLLDWTNDRWIRGVAGELTGPGDAVRRAAAAHRLGQLAQWAGAALPQLEAAAYDPRQHVRAAARNAARRVKLARSGAEPWRTHA